MAELAERIDLQPPVGQRPRVNTPRTVEHDTSHALSAVEALKRNIAMMTAGASLAVTERPAGWLNNYVDDALLRPGSEWTLKGLEMGRPAAAPRCSSGISGYYVTIDPGVHVFGAGQAGSGFSPEAQPNFGIAGSTVRGGMRSAAEASYLFPGSGAQVVAAFPLPVRVAAVNVSGLEKLTRAKRAERDAREEALEDVRKRLDSATARYALLSPQEVVQYLADELGVGQLPTARAVGVTPTAVRKWRRGEPARTEHRTKLARFAALSEVLGEVGPHDPASWLEIPLSSEGTLTPMDLYLAGRSDLVLLQAARLDAPHETLDQFDPEWRAKYAIDTDYEVITLSDGSRSAVPRRQE
jgi:hypothetical protein